MEIGSVLWFFFVQILPVPSYKLAMLAVHKYVCVKSLFLVFVSVSLSYPPQHGHPGGLRLHIHGNLHCEQIRGGRAGVPDHRQPDQDL